MQERVVEIVTKMAGWFGVDPVVFGLLLIVMVVGGIVQKITKSIAKVVVVAVVVGLVYIVVMKNGLPAGLTEFLHGAFVE
ncbi:hypothetical protein [Acetivibrio ethanolgignens]|uniref:Uncharacterized protein n=1 Tax=Acetivibrio ethanolgignens TaxID=290052 RepID=A0A0V8QDD3_9FIRM|nr:hypothetical protein [Acetivibrio ethanolgignens]KSV58262.1 hypothetical protein ASU35_13445 [Acetivibrio ethanolgignens]